MYLATIQIFNYKSFLDSGPIELRPGFNILTGQNNAGKTALLEAMSLQFSSKPHRGLLESGQASAAVGPSHVMVSVVVERDEWRSKLGAMGKGHVVIPIRMKDFNTGPYDHPVNLWRAINNHRELRFDFIARADNQISSMYQSRLSVDDNQHVLLILEENRFLEDMRIMEPESYKNEPPASKGRDIAWGYGPTLKSSIYGFRAERMNIGVSGFGNTADLKPDASNLPEVLNVLQSVNPARFQRYNRLVKRVFPQVEWISVQPIERNQVEILVWSVEPETERADLAVPLSESGTGISQVLAMLYVLVTSEKPRTLLIDEPNSFLHPGAVRALMEILREHPQHQYILSTHSSELIAASNPSTIHILRRVKGGTQVESLGAQAARHFRTVLLEVGSRPSDVFGAENVLWVEGPTEQLCFPLIARRFLKRPLAGVSIVGVLHTGDFDAKRDTRSVFRIYERLSQQGGALMPPAVAFIFDREIRPDKERQDLERESKGKIHFLGRRTYENYLLHPEAIATVLNSINGHTRIMDSRLDSHRIKQWIDERIQDPKYYGKAKSQEYPRDIDAPLLLKDLFFAFSKNSLEYNKVEHSVALTEWLLEHSPEDLKEIGDLLNKVLPLTEQAPSPSRR